VRKGRRKYNAPEAPTRCSGQYPPNGDVRREPTDIKEAADVARPTAFDQMEIMETLSIGAIQEIDGRDEIAVIPARKMWYSAKLPFPDL
jgi:hypothetical protein